MKTYAVEFQILMGGSARLTLERYVRAPNYMAAKALVNTHFADQGFRSCVFLNSMSEKIVSDNWPFDFTY